MARCARPIPPSSKVTPKLRASRTRGLPGGTYSAWVPRQRHVAVSRRWATRNCARVRKLKPCARTKTFLAAVRASASILGIDAAYDDRLRGKIAKLRYADGVGAASESPEAYAEMIRPRPAPSAAWSALAGFSFLGWIAAAIGFIFGGLTRDSASAPGTGARVDVDLRWVVRYVDDGADAGVGTKGTRWIYNWQFSSEFSAPSSAAF